MAAVALGRRIQGEGRVTDAQWRDWLNTFKPASMTIDSMLATQQRLVVVSPHPDDEVLACGGLIALHAGRGGRVAIVAVTDGEASHRGDPRWPAERLVEARRHERRLGLMRLAAASADVTRLRLPDSGVAAQASRVEEALRTLLQPTDVVVSTWRLDGHPDHDATGTATARVCGERGCSLLEAPVWMWHWSHPDDPRVPWPRLRALALPPVTRACKAAALTEHGTQLQRRGSEPPVLGEAIVARAAWATEYFLVPS